jgi:hypothetical protein
MGGLLTSLGGEWLSLILQRHFLQWWLRNRERDMASAVTGVSHVHLAVGIILVLERPSSREGGVVPVFILQRLRYWGVNLYSWTPKELSFRDYVMLGMPVNST